MAPGEYKTVARVITTLERTSDDGFIFVNLTMRTLLLVLAVQQCSQNSAFTNLRNLNSQMGYLVVLKDNDGQGNVLASCQQQMPPCE